MARLPGFDYPPPPRGYSVFRSKYDQTLVEYIKSIPGRMWGGDTYGKAWLIPTEMHEDVAAECKRLGILGSFSHNRSAAPAVEVNPKLYAFQRDAVMMGLAEKSILHVIEMGLGKGVIACETTRLAGCKKVLVISFAQVVSHWKAEFERWAPDVAPHTQVCSWDSLDSLSDSGFDCIILDEIQAVKNYKTARAKNARAICADNPQAMRIGLSGTPADKIWEIYNAFDILWPGRFGWFGAFRDRYIQMGANSGGYLEPVGLREDHKEEFQRRINACCFFATKLEHAHLLPAFTVSQLRINAGTTALPAAVTRESAEQHILDSATEKARGALQWIAEKTNAGVRKLFVATYHINTAKVIANTTNNAVLIHGEMPVAEREEILNRAKASEDVVVVATMKSVGVGIDLTAFQHVLVAELYWSILVMQQLLGRFSRLSGTLPASVELMVLKGTLDEVLAMRLLEKIQSFNESFAAGQASGGIESALSQREDDLIA